MRAFGLQRRGDPSGALVELPDVDDEMRRALGAPPDAREWYQHWYDKLGYHMARGETYDQLRERYESDAALMRAIAWLEANYVPVCW